VVELIDAEQPVVVAIDSPGCCALVGQSARDEERALARAICGIRWTPDRQTVDGNTYYAWIVEGLKLFEALADLDVETIEVFPTASWTRWFGTRGPRTRATWTELGVGQLGLDGVPNRTNQDERDAIAAAMTARQYSEGGTEAIGEIVVPIALTPGGEPLTSVPVELTAKETVMTTPSPNPNELRRLTGSASGTPRVRAARGSSLDFARAEAFIAAIPTGCWTSYKDVATAAGNELGAQAVGDWVRRNGDAVPHVYRVLRIDGLVAEGYHPAGSGLPRDGLSVREVLRREGVIIDAHGRASRSQRFSPQEWRQLPIGHRTA
jgi:predicted nuclease with RNAse H fold